MELPKTGVAKDRSKARSHRGDAWGTHGQHIGNLQFGPVRCRSLSVRHHALLVRRARWTYAGPRYAIVVIRCVRRDFCNMLKSVRGARRMIVHAIRPPKKCLVVLDCFSGVGRTGGCFFFFFFFPIFFFFHFFQKKTSLGLSSI